MKRARAAPGFACSGPPCQLRWFDAHMWAYAERFGLPELISEDFQHDPLYGTVRVVDPFREVRR